MIRNRIVVGIRDQSQSERLQMDAGLTLEKAKTLVQQREAVQEQQILLKHGQKEDKSIDFLRQRVPSKGKVPPRNRSQAPARSHNRRSRSVLDVAEGHTHDNSAQPEMLSATTAKRRGTTVHNVFTRQLQMSPYPQSLM